MFSKLKKNNFKDNSGYSIYVSDIVTGEPKRRLGSRIMGLLRHSKQISGTSHFGDEFVYWKVYEPSVIKHGLLGCFEHEEIKNNFGQSTNIYSIKLRDNLGKYTLFSSAIYGSKIYKYFIKKIGL